MKVSKLFWASAIGLGLATVAWADWNPGDPYKMHFPQLPDLGQTGMDVYASHPYIDPQGQAMPFSKVVADDWQCSQTGPVTDIHIWGSWLNDEPDPAAIFFVTIFMDDPTGPFSKPGDLLRSYVFGPSDYTVNLYAQASEVFYDPNASLVRGQDTLVYQYNFQNIPDPLIQEQGQIYWLAVQAQVGIDTYFGWKTSTAHFQDYAVYGDNIFPAAPMEWKMIVPERDMAFVITTPEPQTYGLIAGLGLGLFGLARRFLRK